MVHQPKTKTFILVLEAPRDQDPGLKDYITDNFVRSGHFRLFVLSVLVAFAYGLFLRDL